MDQQMQTEPQDIGEMIRQKEALERQIQEAQRAARVDALAKIKELMAVNGLTVAHLAGVPHLRQDAPRDTPREKAEPKFRHPETGETWVGRGNRPKWLTKALSEGKSLSEFAVKPQ